MLLLRHGAKVTARDGHGVTPLGIAAEHGNTEALDVLIQHGKCQNSGLHGPHKTKRRHFKDIREQKDKHF